MAVVAFCQVIYNLGRKGITFEGNLDYMQYSAFVPTEPRKLRSSLNAVDALFSTATYLKKNRKSPIWKALQSV